MNGLMSFCVLVWRHKHDIIWNFAHISYKNSMAKPNKCNDFLDHAPVALAKEVVLLDVDQKNLERGMTAPCFALASRTVFFTPEKWFTQLLVVFVPECMFTIVWLCLGFCIYHVAWYLSWLYVFRMNIYIYLYLIKFSIKMYSDLSCFICVNI